MKCLNCSLVSKWKHQYYGSSRLYNEIVLTPKDLINTVYLICSSRIKQFPVHFATERSFTY